MSHVTGQRQGNGTRLADGQWHRLHPATPFLKGGVALLAILGIIIVNLRDLVINTVVGGQAPADNVEPLRWIVDNQLTVQFVLLILLGVLLAIAGFFASWRMHTFRITDEQVEVRSGILFRTNRRGRLDRIQGINVSRPLLARLFGAAILEVTVAGQNANVQLSYVGSSAADELRREILLLASGTQSVASDSSVREGTLLEQRVAELLAPELSPLAVPPEFVVRIPLPRLIGSLLLRDLSVVLIVGVITLIAVSVTTRDPQFLFFVAPAIIGIGGYYFSALVRSLRYSVASTPDGIRIGSGMLSTSNETLPPGRIHAVRVSQPLLWRLTGWWQITINRASHSSEAGSAGQTKTTILPVGNMVDTQRVLRLVLPGIEDPAAIALLDRGVRSGGGDDGFTNSPGRAWVIRWFSWRRNGFAIVPSAVLFRTGAIWRELVVVPQARLQSLGLQQGPLLRRLRLASLALHTVAGPVLARLGALDELQAVRAFEEIAASAVNSARVDTSHHWRVPAQASPADPAASSARSEGESP
ncbi:MAG: PH domain-containing protein [Rhodoglobus sp.]